MIELPEATVLARQMRGALTGKRIAEAVRGNSPHKFAFYSGEPEHYAAVLAGRTIGSAEERGRLIVVAVGDEQALVLGEGGERILYHRDADTLPKKHQLLLRFEDGGWLTVSVQGWGAVLLLSRAELPTHQLVGPRGVSPLEEGFTAARLAERFAELAPDDKRSVKYFFVSEPGVWGVGNGYLQDILYRARVHPRRRAVEVSPEEQQALCEATRAVLADAVAKDGRDTERDLFGRPGRYVRAMDSRTVGRPCAACGTPIEKAAYLGGAIYYCPSCQL